MGRKASVVNRERQEMANRAICIEKFQKSKPFERKRTQKFQKLKPFLDKASLEVSEIETFWDGTNKIDPPE